VPLRHDDYEGFLAGLGHFISNNLIVFARVYSREKMMSDMDYDLISDLNSFDFKWVSSDDPNAADYSLIQSCTSVLNNNKDINHVLLISGDGDFVELTDRLHDRQVAITLICQENNYSIDLVSDVHRAYAVSFVAENSINWWMYR